MEKQVTKEKLSNINIEGFKSLISVSDMEKENPISSKAAATLSEGRKRFIDVLNDKDKRFIVVIGPCSIHDVDAAKEYATKLKALSEKVGDQILIFMRTYFEKPRTALGWKGLINDPNLDGSFDIDKGLKVARKLLLDLAEMGVYTATELLDPITAAYLAHLVTWAAIGARTTESQIHREMVSGLSIPVGFKNATNGDLNVALNAIKSASHPHRFLGTNDDGRISVIHTKGNKNTHIVLRGGIGRPNYSPEEIKKAEQALKEFSFPLKIMVDCSHDNSGKNHEKQSGVVSDILSQKKNGCSSIFSIMLESNLKPGNQKLEKDGKGLVRGVSITDKCIGWEETEEIVLEAHRVLSSL